MPKPSISLPTHSVNTVTAKYYMTGPTNAKMSDNRIECFLPMTSDMFPAMMAPSVAPSTAKLTIFYTTHNESKYCTYRCISDGNLLWEHIFNVQTHSCHYATVVAD